MKVERVHEESFWSHSGVRCGDILARIDGEEVKDIIDVYVLLSDEVSSLEVVRDGKRLELCPNGDEDVSASGIEFGDFDYRRCANRCIFCFIDQMPKGLRESLYFKDEDYRLSFLFGNYLTLTNLSKEDMERIRRLRLSPLYVSVHTTDDDLRRRMLGNPKAPSIMEMLEKLASSGIEVHCQVVLCPGINDGYVLQRTIEDLSELYPSVASVAVVPVGLTEHRNELEEIPAVDAGIAREVIDSISRIQLSMLRDLGSRFVFLADEFYLLVGAPLPERNHYEHFAQIEDGVGMTRQFIEEMEQSSLEHSDYEGTLGMITGSLAAPVIRECVIPKLREVFPKARFLMLAAESSLFGPMVTVTGLLSGEDIVRAARSCDECHAFVVPSNSFNPDGVTLDGMSAEDLSSAIERNVIVPYGNLIDSLVEELEGT
jgi:putative radical SAM enzyme (TIGR03279 family)